MTSINCIDSGTQHVHICLVFKRAAVKAAKVQDTLVSEKKYFLFDLEHMDRRIKEHPNTE